MMVPQSNTQWSMKLISELQLAFSFKHFVSFITVLGCFLFLVVLLNYKTNVEFLTILIPYKTLYAPGRCFVFSTRIFYSETEAVTKQEPGRCFNISMETRQECHILLKFKSTILWREDRMLTSLTGFFF